MIGVARIVGISVFVCRGFGECVAIRVLRDFVPRSDSVWPFVAFRSPSCWEAFDMEVEVGSALGEFFDFGVCHGCVDGGGAGGVVIWVGIFIGGFSVGPVWVDVGGLDAVPCDFEKSVSRAASVF